MSELNERQWAVLSERGCEAAGLPYAEAAQLVSQLKEDKVFGLCIITDEAARRIAHVEKLTADAHSSNNSNQRQRQKR